MSLASKPHAVFKHIIVDRSGSMNSFCGKHIEMCHRLLMETQEESEKTGIKTHISLTTFDDKVNYPMDLVDPTKEDMPDQSQLQKMLYPRGSTRFNDTLIEEVEKLKSHVDNYKKNLPLPLRRLDPLIVTIVIAITDGFDNVSQNSTEICRNIMNTYRKNRGQAILMTANMDAEIVGSNYGFNSDRCITVHNSDEQAIESGFNSIGRLQREMTQGMEVTPITHIERALSCPMTDPIDYFDTISQQPIPALAMPPALTRNLTVNPYFDDRLTENQAEV